MYDNDIFKQMGLGNDFIEVYETFMDSILNLKPTEKKPQRLELRPAELTENYIKKWNVNVRDNYCHLFVDGVKKSNTLYRLGGMSDLTDGKDYYMILKYLEESYDNNITTDLKKKLHLASHSTIIDKDGNEKVVFDRFKHPYLQGGIIYSIDGGYYNIETGEEYCKSSSNSFDSENYIFVDNSYDLKDKNKRGVMKIDKRTGEVELFKSKR